MRVKKNDEKGLPPTEPAVNFRGITSDGIAEKAGIRREMPSRRQQDRNRNEKAAQDGPLQKNVTR